MSPITGQYPGHVISLDQSEASIRSRDLLSVTRAQDGVIKDEDDDVDTS